MTSLEVLTVVVNVAECPEKRLNSLLTARRYRRSGAPVVEPHCTARLSGTIIRRLISSKANLATRTQSGISSFCNTPPTFSNLGSLSHV